jgi:hypothetical protein
MHLLLTWRCLSFCLGGSLCCLCLGFGPGCCHLRHCCVGCHCILCRQDTRKPSAIKSLRSLRRMLTWWLVAKNMAMLEK